MEMTMLKVTASAAASALALALIAAPAFAQSASGTVQLRGNVALSCTVAVQDLGQALNLKGGENAKTVGSVTENCNSGNGYRITLASANAGKMKNGTFTIDYTVNYDNQGGALNNAMTLDRNSAQFGKKADLKVSIAASDQYIAGDYSDTVTVTIAAK
jgi:spore coat protein U-like protein